MRRHKRAMVMIIVVILIAAITTIIAASVDLSRMAVYKQNQAEREAKWHYCVDSGQAFVVEDLVALVGTTQSFSKTVNGIDLTVNAIPDGAWNSSTSTQIAVTGLLEGKSRTTKLYVGKRATVQPCQFGMFFTDKFRTDLGSINSGDVYLAGSIVADGLSQTGDIYSPDISAPPTNSFSGIFYGRQPRQHIVLDDAAYLANASIVTSGTTTLKNPTNLSLSSRSQLRYHTGNLTISGTTTGEITIYVSGTVNLSNVTNSLIVLGRLVVICNGDVFLEKGIGSDAFVICNGKVSETAPSGIRTINGSMAGAELVNPKTGYVVNFNNYFVANPDGGIRYWLPGQW